MTAVVTDNEKKMDIMRKQLKDDIPDLTVYGCSSHILNLLGQDLTPNAIISQIVEVNKYFRNHHVPGALLAEFKGSVKPQLPNQTRWNSQLMCVETYITNRPFMMLIIAQDESVVDNRIKNIVHNIRVVNEAKHFLTQLSHVGKALNSLQSDSVTIADACEHWLTLLECEELQPHIKNSEKTVYTSHDPYSLLSKPASPAVQRKKVTR